jgi:hypothetical protein
MNTYGNLAETVRRVAAYQQAEIQYAPGYGDGFYRVTVHENKRRASDVFYIKTDAHLNHALNTLLNKAIYHE